MILTDEEIGNLYGEWCKNPNPPYTRFMQVVAQAQDRKTRKATHDWGNESCPHNHRGKLTKIGIEPLSKRECPTCWQSLIGE
jgi:hypothetical protein